MTCCDNISVPPYPSLSTGSSLHRWMYYHAALLLDMNVVHLIKNNIKREINHHFGMDHNHL